MADIMDSHWSMDSRIVTFVSKRHHGALDRAAGSTKKAEKLINSALLLVH
jgi:hypothetical protein